MARQSLYIQDTSVDTAQGLPSIPTWAEEAHLQCESQSIRFRTDDTNPTTSIGMLLMPAAAAGSSPSTVVFKNMDLSKVKIIAATSGAKVNVTYWGSDV